VFITADGWKTTPPDQLHFTLKFLGEVDASRVDALIAGVRTTVAPFGPFDLTFGEVGAFPQIRHAHLVWAGVAAGGPPLGQLADGVDVACERLGFARETRPFVPHMTVARLGRRARERSVERDVRRVRLPHEARMRVREVVLYRSDLGPGGPTYTALARAPLGGVAAEAGSGTDS
jgi:2'-5' RNA ligase